MVSNQPSCAAQHLCRCSTRFRLALRLVFQLIPRMGEQLNVIEVARRLAAGPQQPATKDLKTALIDG